MIMHINKGIPDFSNDNSDNLTNSIIDVLGTEERHFLLVKFNGVSYTFNACYYTLGKFGRLEDFATRNHRASFCCRMDIFGPVLVTKIVQVGEEYCGCVC